MPMLRTLCRYLAHTMFYASHDAVLSYRFSDSGERRWRVTHHLTLIDYGHASIFNSASRVDALQVRE